MARFTNGLVISRDGTVIGYRQMGRGPGPLLVHGGLNAGQHLMQLAEQLADALTLYVPDRRGRGLSRYSGENTLTLDAMISRCLPLIPELCAFWGIA